MKKAVEKLTISIARQLAEVARPFYKNGKIISSKSTEYQIVLLESAAYKKFSRLCNVATKCGDWERNGEFNRFFDTEFKKALGVK